MMLSDAASVAKRGLKVRGTPTDAMRKRPPNWPGSALETSGLGGRGWPVLGLEDLPQPATARRSKMEVQRWNRDQEVLVMWLCSEEAEYALNATPEARIGGAENVFFGLAPV